MKTKLLFSLLILGFFILNTTAQTIHDIEINFKKRTIDPLPEIKEADYYRIVVDSINLNLWKVSLNTKDTVLASSLKTPTFGDFNIGALSTLVANLNKVTSAGQAIFNSLDTSMSEMIYINNSADPIANRLDQEQRTLDSLSMVLDSIRERIDDLKYNVGIKHLSAFEEDDVLATTFDLKQALKDIVQLRKDIDVLNQSIKDKKSSYETFSKEHADEIKKKPKYIKEDKARKDVYGKFIAATNTIKEAVNAEKSIELLKSIIFLKVKIGTYKSLPIQFKGDQAQVKLKFEPRKPEYNLQSYEMPFVFPLKSDNYWSIGVSFYGSNLYDQRYSTKGKAKTDSTQVFTLVQEKEQKSEIGIATLLRAGEKFGDEKKCGVHISLGPAISISEKIRARLLLGGGFSAGKKHSISVDIGGIVGHVDRISNAFDLNEEYSQKPENITISELQVGYFIAIGYLFRF